MINIKYNKYNDWEGSLITRTVATRPVALILSSDMNKAFLDDFLVAKEDIDLITRPATQVGLIVETFLTSKHRAMYLVGEDGYCWANQFSTNSKYYFIRDVPPAFRLTRNDKIILEKAIAEQYQGV